MSTLKVNTVESATTPTVLISDGLSVSGVSTLTGGLKVGTAVTISDNGNFGITGIMTASSYSGITSTALPSGSILQVLQTVKNLTRDKENPLTTLWITHRHEELIYADAVAEMKNGNLSNWQKPLNFQYN